MSHPLANRINDLTKKARRTALGTAAGWLCAVAVGVAFLLMAGDYLTRLTDPGMPWLAAALLLVAVAAAAWRWFGGAGWRRLTPLVVAQQVQDAKPNLGSRLASAVEFLDQEIDEPSAGSADLRRSVVAQATGEVEQADLGDVIDRRGLWRALQTLAVGVAAFVAFGLADPVGLKTAAGRLLAPWSDQSWPRRHHLAFVDAPDRIARGQDFEALLSDDQGARLPADLRVQYRTRVGGDETRVEEQLLPAAGVETTLRRENVQQPFSYRAAGGDDNAMPWRKVEVVDPPKLAAMSMKDMPPAYSGLSGRKLRKEDRVLAGSRLLVVAESTEPIARAALEVTAGEKELSFDFEQSSGDQQSLSLTLPEGWDTELVGVEPVTASCRLRLENEEGLVGFSQARNLRIDPDSVPALEWISPSHETFVTSQALASVRVLVEDNLAVARVEFLSVKAQATAADDTQPIAPNRTTIHTGPDEPPRHKSPPWGAPADSREVSHEFDLALLDLTPGDQLSLMVEATDFRPGTGRTSLPRRLTILSEEDFDARLAEKQADLTRDLMRLLGDQRSARAGAGELQIERQNGAEADRTALDRLAALGFEQLRVNEGVDNPARGAIAQAREMLDEIERNRQQRPELVEQLESIRQELRQLSASPLASAGRDLADARRATQQAIEKSSKQSEKELDESLAEATRQQDRAIETLEGLVDRMSDWSDYQRFAQEIADLENRQQELRKETLKEAAKAAAAGKDSPERAAARAKLRAAQAEIARRFGKLQDAMRRAADKSQEGASASSQSLRDALAESRDRATRGKLNEAERQLRIGQLGMSAREQQSGAEDLQEMLDILRDRASSDPGKLAEQLQKTQEKLAELQKELDELQKKANEGGQRQPRKKLAEKTDRLGRRMNRLDAQDAGQSAQQGAGKMQESSEEGEQGRKSLADAQENLQQSQEQLEEKIRQLKNLVALRELDRLAAKMDGFIERQKNVLEDTVRTDDQIDSGIERQELKQEIDNLADDQKTLRTEVDVARRNVAKREVFEMALQGIVDEMGQARERLNKQDVGRTTQQREFSALERLKHVADALKLNPPEPEENKKEGGQGGQAGEKPPSPVDVAELKMLRLIQLDLNAQTRELEGEAAARRISPREAKQESERLSEEQSRLGDLVRELIERNNKPRPKPGELPDDAA